LWCLALQRLPFQHLSLQDQGEIHEVVDVDNSIVFYEALRHHKVPAEMHLYPKGNHGFVLSIPTEEWMAPLFLWMKSNKWMN
jgi:dipeptidyl aminopeptidase/acylaminoacyl peptidase